MALQTLDELMALPLGTTIEYLGLSGTTGSYQRLFVTIESISVNEIQGLKGIPLEGQKEIRINEAVILRTEAHEDIGDLAIKVASDPLTYQFYQVISKEGGVVTQGIVDALTPNLVFYAGVWMSLSKFQELGYSVEIVEFTASQLAAWIKGSS